MKRLGTSSFKEEEDTFTDSRISAFSDFGIIEVDPFSILFNVANVMAT